VPASEPGGGFNPLRNEADMFKVLLGFVAFVAAIVIIVLVVQAL
jgi:hypothetical protein